MVTQIVLPMVIGLALFLYGMKVMEVSLHQWAGPYLKNILESFTHTPWRGLMTGTVLTSVVQSSSAVTVITIGLVNAGVMTFPQTLGVILGTNIGSSITTELIGLNLNAFDVPLLIAAAIIWFISLALTQQRRQWRHSKRRKFVQTIRNLSLAAAGFACILMGLDVMQSIVPALQSRGLFAWFVELSQKSLLWGVVAGAALTAIIHSSAASIAIAMGLASVDAISIELGVAIVLGANIGTCSTAFIASIGSNRYGHMVAWSHILLNVIGTCIFFPLLSHLVAISAMLSSSPSGQIAHAQTIFNFACSLAALPICYLPWFVRKTSIRG